MAFSDINFVITLGKFISSSFIEKLATLLEIDSDNIKVDILWTFSNMASVSSEAVEILRTLKIHTKAVHMMRFGSAEVKLQCLWLLPNMSADSAGVRSELLETDLIEQIITIVEKNRVVAAILENVCWLISSICKSPSHHSIVKVPS